jgi:PIN like domain
VKVLIDHNISYRIAHALAILAEPAGNRVFAKSDLFDTTVSVPDVQWMAALGKEGESWAFISDDPGIYKNPQERAVMVSARIIGFFLEPAWRKPKVSEFERAARLIRWWPKLMKQCEIVSPPAAFGIPINPTSRLRSLPLPKK